MKPLVAALAAVLLSSCRPAKAPSLEQAGTTQIAPAPRELLAASDPAALPDPAPADALEPAPSAEEVAAFQAAVPK